MASLHLNRHGYFFIRFRWGDLQCSEGTKVKGRREGRKAIPLDPGEYTYIQKVAQEISKGITAGTFNYLEYFPKGNRAAHFKPGGASSFRGHAQNWLDEKRPPEGRQGTWEFYRSIIDSYLIPLFGSEPLSYFSADQDHAKRRLKKALIQNEVSPTRMKAVFKALRTILSAAGLSFKVPKFSGDDQSRKVQRLTPDERDIFMAAVDQHWEPFFTVAFRTGMRPSELAGLIESEDFDFHYREIGIYRSLVVGIEGAAKTRVSQRTIEMSEEVAAALHRFQLIRRKIKNIKHPYFFCTKAGRVITAAALLDKVWKPTLAKAKLKPRPNVCRHTFASIALSEGRKPDWVAHMMGDSIQTIAKHYYNFIGRDATRYNIRESERTPSDKIPQPEGVPKSQNHPVLT